MPFNSKIVSTKGSGIKKLMKATSAPGTVAVGIIDAGTHGDDGVTTAEVGFANEFGTSKIPERSFIRATLSKERKDIINSMKPLLVGVINGKSPIEKALGLLGIDVADRISQTIVKLRTPPNAPETVQRKGSSNPLVDTGQLKNSITWKVGNE